MRFVATLLALIIAVPASADHRGISAPAESKTLVLKDLIQEGLEKNAGLTASKAEVVSREAEVGPKRKSKSSRGNTGKWRW